MPKTPFFLNLNLENHPHRNTCRSIGMPSQEFFLPSQVLKLGFEQLTLKLPPLLRMHVQEMHKYVKRYKQIKEYINAYVYIYIYMHV